MTKEEIAALSDEELVSHLIYAAERAPSMRSVRPLLDDLKEEVLKRLRDRTRS